MHRAILSGLLNSGNCFLYAHNIRNSPIKTVIKSNYKHCYRDDKPNAV